MTESSSLPKEESIIDPRPSNVVSRIDGVRPCLQCGHDLHGQPIRREESLGLLVTFCPECGQAASLVDYPILGIWGRRLGVLSLVCMIIMVLVFLVVSVMSLFGIIMGLTSELYSPAQSALASMIDGGWQIERAWWEGMHDCHCAFPARRKWHINRLVISWQELKRLRRARLRSRFCRTWT